MNQFSKAAVDAAIAAAKECHRQQLKDVFENHKDELEKLAAETSVSTPLHDACCGTGNSTWVKALLTLIPEHAHKKNGSGLSPLHIAAAQSDVEIAKELVEGRRHLCLLKGPNDRIPLHDAIENGQVRVMQELISVSPESIEETTSQKETGLHLAVKHGEAFKELVKHLKKEKKKHVINWKDDQGNTALHLAVAAKNLQVVKFMHDEHAQGDVFVAVNAHNNYGETPLDFVGRGGDREIRGLLNALGAKHGGESRADIRNALLVVAGLIASTTYQSVLQPPKFKAVVNKTHTEGFRASYASYMTGFYGRDLAYIVFITGNTFGLLVAVQMIICLTRDLSVRLPMLLSMTLMVQTYYCHTYYLPFGTQEKEFGLINAELLSVLPLMIPILLLLFQKRLAEALEVYLEKLSLFDDLGDMYYI